MASPQWFHPRGELSAAIPFVTLAGDRLNAPSLKNRIFQPSWRAGIIRGQAYDDARVRRCFSTSTAVASNLFCASRSLVPVLTFYQILAGSLPFSASDPMEWAHCHIAAKPEAPSECFESIRPRSRRSFMKLRRQDAVVIAIKPTRAGRSRSCFRRWTDQCRVASKLVYYAGKAWVRQLLRRS